MRILETLSGIGRTVAQSTSSVAMWMGRQVGIGKSNPKVPSPVQLRGGLIQGTQHPSDEGNNSLEAFLMNKKGLSIKEEESALAIVRGMTNPESRDYGIRAVASTLAAGKGGISTESFERLLENAREIADIDERRGAFNGIMDAFLQGNQDTSKEDEAIFKLFKAGMDGNPEGKPIDELAGLVDAASKIADENTRKEELVKIYDLLFQQSFPAEEKEKAIELLKEIVRIVRA